MQSDILEKHRVLPFRVYAVWFNMVWTDSRSRWPARSIADPRVAHFWDEKKLLGRWYSERISDGKHIVWDTFLLYPPGAKLDAPLDSLLAAGATIIEAREDLRRGVDKVAQAQQPQAGSPMRSGTG